MIGTISRSVVIVNVVVLVERKLKQEGYSKYETRVYCDTFYRCTYHHAT
jgi:hypothetical protein